MLSAATGTKIFTNPDVGLTDAQREQNYSDARDAFNARYQAWLASLDFATINYSGLDRAPLNAYYDAPAEPSLSAAKAKADLIVLGNVRSIRPTAFDGTYVTLDVDSSIKGAAASTVVIHQGGGLRPTPDWKGMYIAYAEDAPLLIPQDRAMVFLYRAQSGALEIQSFTGLYRSKAGRLSSVPGNPFAASVDGTSETAFTAAVKGLP